MDTGIKFSSKFTSVWLEILPKQNERINMKSVYLREKKGGMLSCLWLEVFWKLWLPVSKGKGRKFCCKKLKGKTVHRPISCGNSWKNTATLVEKPSLYDIENPTAIAMPSAKLWTVSASTITAALEDIPREKKIEFRYFLYNTIKVCHTNTKNTLSYFNH